MRDFTCPNRTCGDTKRTVVAKKASPTMLVVSRWLECVEVEGRYRLTCPVCGRFIWWAGELARQMPRAA